MAKDPQLPQIPCEIQKEILPDKDLSVLDILKFRLPAAARSNNGSFNHSQKFLSTLTPMLTNIEEIWTIPTPPLAVLDELVKAPELLTVYFQLVEIDGNRHGNVNGWSACLAVWQSPPIKRRLDEHIV